ncbi:MAG TPA: SDR family NAD(P)-dependent oxidoreductase [Aggregatilineales bacterium]|nr:SDR family NAD(P)-dependent oxidoreductase [Aggregatilineales bacterium]
MAHTTSAALITGASRGLGRAFARELARKGWTLILDARGSEVLEEVRAELAAQTQVIAIPGDVADAGHRAALLAAVRSVGGLNVLVNNASTLGPSPRPDLLDYPLEALQTVYQTNVIAPLALIQTLRRDFRPQPRLINVTSDAGVEPYAGWGGYGSSKAALEQLSAILASEHPEWRVYWVDPGDMRTQMHQEAFPGEDISDRPLPEESIPGFIALIEGDLPSGRYQARALALRAPDQEKRAPVEGLRVVLTVGDFARAVDLYRDGLGLPVLDQWISAESQGMLLSAGPATLELVDEAQAAEVDRIEVGKRSAGTVRLAFTVGNTAASTTALLSKGAAPVGDAVVTPWGHRNQRLTAPLGVQDGIQLTLSQVVGEKETL